MSKAQAYADIFQLATTSTYNVATKLSEAVRMKVIQPGKAHPLWLIGHLASTDNGIILRNCCEKESLFPKELTRVFAPDFLQGDPIVTDPAKYPSWDETLGLYKKVTDACVAGIRDLSDDVLPGELRGNAPDALKQFFKSVDYAVRAMTLHDAHHRGQIALIAGLK